MHGEDDAPLDVVFVLDREVVGHKPDRVAVERCVSELMQSAAPEAAVEMNVFPSLGAFVVRASADVVRKLLADRRITAARTN